MVCGGGYVIVYVVCGSMCVWCVWGVVCVRMYVYMCDVYISVCGVGVGYVSEYVYVCGVLVCVVCVGGYVSEYVCVWCVDQCVYGVCGGGYVRECVCVWCVSVFGGVLSECVCGMWRWGCRSIGAWCVRVCVVCIVCEGRGVRVHVYMWGVCISVCGVCQCVCGGGCQNVCVRVCVVCGGGCVTQRPCVYWCVWCGWGLRVYSGVSVCMEGVCQSVYIYHCVCVTCIWGVSERDRLCVCVCEEFVKSGFCVEERVGDLVSMSPYLS